MTDLREQLQSGLADRYRIERELGRGGMAMVFLAHDLRHDRHVALKVLHPELAHAIGAERFLREIKLTAGLQHPHILSVHDSGETAGHLWFTMPFVDGETLRDRLTRERQLGVDDALRIAIETARALEHAHKHGIIHRDIKPENLLLTKDGSTLVADFGIARALGSGHLTETGLAVGTPHYMSPEQAGADVNLDARTDIYSLGCVVFEMLAGEPPFSATTPQGVLAKHKFAPVPNLRIVRGSISETLQHVLETALAKAPADRFKSAGDFARALALPATSLRATRQPWRQPAMALGFAAVLLAIVLFLAPGREAPSAADAAGQPRIAVLYFEDRTPDSTLRLFADGLTEELIHELSGVGAFRVISRNGVKAYRDRQVPFDSIVAALRPTMVVDGNVERSGDRLRVRVGLIDARSDTYVDSMSLEQPVSDFMSMRRDLAQQVAAALRRQMGRVVRLRGAASGTRSELARDLVLKAERSRNDAEILAEQPNGRDLQTAIEMLGRADSLLALAQAADSQWLRPPIERGWVARDRARLVSGTLHDAEIKRGLSFAESAVVSGPENAEALELRGTLLFQVVTEVQGAPNDSVRLRQAETDLRAALDRDSTLAGSWATLSYLLWYKGNTAEAELVARRALSEDPYLREASGVFRRLFFSELMLGDFGQAAEWCRRGRLSFPNDWHFVECELTLMRHNVHATPKPDSAWALVRELDRLDPAEKARGQGRAYHTIYRRVVAAAISARAGHHDVARAELARAIRATEGDSTLRMDLAYDEAYLRLALGEPERAAELLRRYIKARPMASNYLARDPLWKGFRLND